MIRFRDVITLARAKLHSRRILLLLTILTSSLLFGSLYASTFIASGVERSMESLTDEAHDGKYLVKANPVIPQDVYPSTFDLDAKTISEINSLHAAYTEKAKRAAKESNVPFDEASIKPTLKPSPIKNPALPDDKQLMIDFSSPVYGEYREILLKRYAENAKNTKDHLRTVASQYDYTDIFSTITAKTSYTDTVYLKDDKENLDYLLKNPEPQTGSSTPYGFAINSVQNSMYQMFDDSLLRNWLLPSNKKRADNGDAIPVIITTKEAETLFGKSLSIPEEPSEPTEKINWIRNLQDKINGQKYTSCYRNNADRLQMARALNDLSEIKANENKQDYTHPKVVYNLPTEACSGLSINKDTRTPNEKKMEQIRIEADIHLSKDSKPQRGVLEFQVVGVIDLDEKSFDVPRSIEALADNLLNNNLNTGALIPMSLYETTGAKAKYDNMLFGENTKGSESLDIYTKYGLLQNVLAFNDLSSARQFIENEGCPESTPDCEKLFRLEPFGSNYLLLDDLQATVRKTIDTILPIVMGIAGIIMFFTMSRVIIDSRRETAVFRALGAKRSDIAVIYITYSLLVSIITLIVSVATGAIIAMVVQALYGSSLTARAHVAYGLFDSATSFTFFGVSYILLAAYAISIIALGVLAAAIPLSRNVRRNPITDMREE